MYNYLVQVIQGEMCPWETKETIAKEFIIEIPFKKSVEEIKKILLDGKLSGYKGATNQEMGDCFYTNILIKEVHKESLYF